MVMSRSLADDVPVGLVDLGPSLGHPGHERGVHLLDRGEGPAGQDMVAHDQHLPLAPSLAGGAVGGQHIDVEVVMAGESDRLRMPVPGLKAAIRPSYKNPQLLVLQRCLF